MNGENNVWRNSLKIPNQESQPNEMEKYSLYSDYTTEQKRGFIEVLKLVDKCIRILQEEGELTEYIAINARIKSAESALRNDDKSNKPLNDVFGIEIVAGNERALEKIMNRLDEIMNVTRYKKHDKDNGYKATHKIMELKREFFEKLEQDNLIYDHVPMVEFQFKTFAVKENATSGNANHWKYKAENKEEIQAKYDRNEFNEHNLPIMYTIEGHRIRILNKQETIKAVYPFIKLKNIEKGAQR